MNNNVNRKNIVEEIRNEIEVSRGTRTWKDNVSALRLISQVVFTRSSGFVLELIQNAEDSGLGLKNQGTFEIRLNKDRIRISHNGRPFSENNVSAICSISPTKRPEQGTLGYLGIGFKSVFKISDCPTIFSDGFQFKFDRNYWDDPSKTPWQVIPIWVDDPPKGIDAELTTFIIPYREKAFYSSLAVELEKLSSGLYLFLRWLRKIVVINEVSGRSWTLENVGDDKEGVTTLKHDNEEMRFKFFRRTVTVPDWVKEDMLVQDYRADVTKREVAIAFALDEEGNLAPLEAGAMYGGVYSFLPLGEARSGAKFPIQADFLVQPGRDAINYETKWNHWLVDEVVDLCTEAIEYFKKHDRWKYQFLPVFEFKKSEGLESYDELFGPKLIEPVEKFLEENDCIPTKDNGWAKPQQAVRLTEDDGAINDLVEMGILQEDEMASALGGRPDLKIVHPEVLDCEAKPIKKVNRWELLKNQEFLENKSNTPDAADWFRSLYLWLNRHPFYGEPYSYYRRIRRDTMTYHNYNFILTSDGKILRGGDVSLMDRLLVDPIFIKMANKLKSSKAMLHPDILSKAVDENDSKEVRGFLTGLTGVQVLDEKKVCKEAIIPKILVDAPKPSPKDLLDYTILCQKILGHDIDEELEIWILTKQKAVKASKEVFFPKEFQPEHDWETNKQFVSGLSFISLRYIKGISDSDQLRTWREFFRAAGVKRSPNNGVEEFAISYAKEKLRIPYKDVKVVDKRNFGYDLAAISLDDKEIQVEVKGQSSDDDVELTGNETEAADRLQETFYLCVVSSIPENPIMHMVQNPAAPGVGKKDKLTIPVSIWKSTRWP